MIESRGQVFKCSPKSCDTSLLQPPADDKNAQKGSSSHSCSIPSKEKSVIMLSYHYRVRLERWNMWSRLTVCGPVGSHTTWAVKVIHLTAAAAAQHHRRAVVKSGLRSVQHFPEGQLAQKYEGGGGHWTGDEEQIQTNVQDWHAQFWSMSWPGSAGLHLVKQNQNFQ